MDTYLDYPDEPRDHAEEDYLRDMANAEEAAECSHTLATADDTDCQDCGAPAKFSPVESRDTTLRGESPMTRTFRKFVQVDGDTVEWGAQVDHDSVRWFCDGEQTGAVYDQSASRMDQVIAEMHHDGYEETTHHAG